MRGPLSASVPLRQAPVTSYVAGAGCSARVFISSYLALLSDAYGLSLGVRDPLFPSLRFAGPATSDEKVRGFAPSLHGGVALSV